MQNIPTPESIQDLESIFDNVAHEFINEINLKEEEISGDPDWSLIDEYYAFRNKIQKRIRELYPDYKFDNF